MACIPDFPAISSRRVRVWARGQVSTGTAGIGTIVVTPDYAVANDGVAGFATTAAYAGTTLAVNSGTPGVVQIKSNADYTVAQIADDQADIQYRIVGSGLRIKYAGTELNRGGQIYGLQEPTHNSLDGMDLSDFMKQETARKFTMSSREWTTICYRPTNANSQFQSADPSILANQSKATLPHSNYMGFIIQSPNAAAITVVMEYEFYTVVEYSGASVRGIQNSHVDIAGFSAVHTVSQHGAVGLPSQGSTKAREESFFQEIGRYLLEGLTWVGDHAGEIASVVGTVASLL